jgi:hypothetical protein
MIVPGDQHAVVRAEQAIAACRSLLDALHRSIQHRKWSRVSQLAVKYSEQVRALASNADDGLREDLIQLEIRHRRCMRMLSRHMKAVAEDIASLEGGQKNLQRSREASISLFQS